MVYLYVMVAATPPNLVKNRKQERLIAMPSDFIKRKTTQTILRAFDYAKYIDKPLNNFVTVRLAGLPLEQGHAAFDGIRHKCYDWLKRKQKLATGHADAPYYVYAFENPEGEGLHLHLIVHIPENFRREFVQKLPGWVSKALKGKLEVDGHDIHVKRVDPYTDKTLAKYLVKGTDQDFWGHFYLEDYGSSQGPVVGPRAGASMALNRQARKVAGFVARRHRNAWKTRSWATRRSSARNRPEPSSYWRLPADYDHVPDVATQASAMIR